MLHWLMKSEPDAYSLDRLRRDGVTGWEGVRNYQARNLMRDRMSVGDQVLFYHSSTGIPGVAGLARVTRTGLADPSQFNADGPYFDPKSTPGNPRWIMVEIGFVEKFARFVPLSELRTEAPLEGLMVLQRGARLSVQPVSPEHFAHICRLGHSQHHTLQEAT